MVAKTKAYWQEVQKLHKLDKLLFEFCQQDTGSKEHAQVKENLLRELDQEDTNSHDDTQLKEEARAKVRDIAANTSAADASLGDAAAFIEGAWSLYENILPSLEASLQDKCGRDMCSLVAVVLGQDGFSLHANALAEDIEAFVERHCRVSPEEKGAKKTVASLAVERCTELRQASPVEF